MIPPLGSISDLRLRIADWCREANPQSEIRNPKWSCGAGACRGTGGRRRQAGFSLGELLAVVIVGSMILTAILTIYGRAQQAADAVLRKIDSPAWASEVLQLIARDLDRILNADGVTVQIRNGIDNRFQRAELVLKRTYHNNENKELTLEEITWRAGYDQEGSSPGLVLYRGYQGVASEDKLLDDNREAWEKEYPLVPVCRGVTFFRIQACKGQELLDQWPASAPPPGVKITISFGEPNETISGVYDVVAAHKISRIVAIDPTRKVQFALLDRGDPNAVADPNAAAPKKEESDRPAPKAPRPNERTTNEPTSAPTRSR